MKKRNILIIPILLSSIILLGKDDHKADDSINIVMDLNIDPNRHEERRRSLVFNVRLYITEEKTVIMWSDEGDFYLYTMQDYNHQERGLILFDPIADGDMISYVFERTPQKRIKFSKYFKVIALQIEKAFPLTNQSK